MPQPWSSYCVDLTTYSERFGTCLGETGIEPCGTSFILDALGVVLEYDFLAFQGRGILFVGRDDVFECNLMSGTVCRLKTVARGCPSHAKATLWSFWCNPRRWYGDFLSDLLADGTIDLLAPQANAFAGFTVMLAEGQGNLSALLIGFLLGAFIEWVTGMGTSFGLGMYLPTPYTFPMMIGGAGRDWWQAKRLDPAVDKIREQEGNSAAEKKRALILLTTFMIAAVALTGEAFFGVEAAVLAVVDELPAVVDIFGSAYWIVRLVGFTIINLIIFGGLYTLFRKAGIFGQQSAEA